MSPTTSSSVRRSEADHPPVTSGVAHIGCSGWHYQSWRGVVYPAALPASSWLRAYSRRFPTVELNNSFYRLPSEETFALWRAQVARGFLFSVKASRFLTHIKRLREPDEPLHRLFTHARPLGPTLGPVLYQIPPRWFPDADRLETFLAALPERLTPHSRRRLQHVLEMRDVRGYEPWVLDLLRQYNVTLCVHDMPGCETPLLTTGGLVYIRFHGYGAKYGGSYPDEVLDEWADWMRRLLAAGRDVYAYFNNDLHGYAVYDAERLRLRVEGPSALAGREPMCKPEPRQNVAAYPTYRMAGARRRAPRRTGQTTSTRKGETA